MSRLVDIEPYIQYLERCVEKVRMYSNDGATEIDEIIKELKELPTADIDKDVRAGAYSEGMNDAWELARKITIEFELGGFGAMELCDIFGTSDIDMILTDFTPQEALLKLEAYEKNLAEGFMQMEKLIKEQPTDEKAEPKWKRHMLSRFMRGE